MAEEQQDRNRSRIRVSGNMKEHLIMNLNYLKKMIQLKNLKNGIETALITLPACGM